MGCQHVYLTKPTLGVSIKNRTGFTIPAGELIEVPVIPDPADRTVDVFWRGELFLMFINDLKERSMPEKHDVDVSQKPLCETVAKRPPTV